MPYYFNKNKKYKFSLDKYRESTNTYYIPNDSWTRQCENKYVCLMSKTSGRIDDYTVTPEWCIEVANFKYNVGEIVNIYRNGTYYIKKIEDRMSKKTWYGKRVNYYFVKYAFGYIKIKENKLRKHRSE